MFAIPPLPSLSPPPPPPPSFWAEPFRALCSKNRLIKFEVLDVQPVRTEAARDAARSVRGRFTLVEVTVARPRDVGDPERSYTVVSHLGNVLQTGDTCLGYDLENAVVNDSDRVRFVWDC